MRTSFAIACIVVTTIAAPCSVSAQDSSDDERARLHFAAGRSYFEEGNYEQALDEFNRSYDLSHRTVLLVNISNCQERLGRWREAADSLQAFVATLPETDEQRATMLRRIENLRARAGQHDAEEQARLAREAQEAQTVSTTTSTSTATEPASDGLLVPSLIAFGVGGAALIAWGTLGGLALAEESNVSSGCGATRSCTPAQVQSMDDLALGADISLAIGLAGIATGAILLVVAPPHGEIRHDAQARVVPFGSRDGAGLLVRGTF